MNGNKMRRRTIVSLLTFALAAAGLYGAWRGARQAPDAGGLPAPFRAALETNGAIWRGLFGANLSVPRGLPPPGKRPRVNGDLGLEAPVDAAAWRLEVLPPEGAPEARRLSLSMEDLRKLPRAESSAEFRCIEGWSEPITYAGVRFADFLRILGLGGRRGPAPFQEPRPADLLPYVALETPDGEYYVSLDMESMLHPQTILAYEMNGQPLRPENGAPLRLVVPVKYGFKSLKRIGRISFSAVRPRDYWAENGYDWFAGL
jgi:hypothetical protein